MQDGRGSGAVGGDLGPMPAASIALLCSLGGVWLLLVVYLIREALKKKKAA